MLLEVLLAGGDELDSGKLEAVSNVRMQETYDGRQDSLPSVLEAGDDGSNEATLEREMLVHGLSSCRCALLDVFTWTPSGLIAMKL